MSPLRAAKNGRLKEMTVTTCTHHQRREGAEETDEPTKKC
jgi:hypothetical protein